jgi:hypothetical protein
VALPDAGQPCLGEGAPRGRAAQALCTLFWMVTLKGCDDEVCAT